MHIGNAFTALLAWLQIRKLQGSFVLRMEDLDPERSRSDYAMHIMHDLQWLGLDWDEGPDIGGPYSPYTQSERRTGYEAALRKLIRAEWVYPCFCSREDIRAATLAPHDSGTTSEYMGTCRNLTEQARIDRIKNGDRHSLRLRLPDTQVFFKDLCQGKQTFALKELGDFILQRSDGFHAYQLAVVVDDAEMKITHVLRGEDLLPSTARQIILYQALGYPIPKFTHVPLLYGSDGYRLSKRHGDISIRFLREKGMTAPQVVGYLAFLAGQITSPKPMKPLDLIARFELAHIPQKRLVVNLDDLS